jgi:hypothetical protein
VTERLGKRIRAYLEVMPPAVAGQWGLIQPSARLAF